MIHINGNKLKKIVVECVDRIISESNEGFDPDETYTHFLVRKSDNKIVDGWDYRGLDVSDIKYYAKLDMEDNGYDPKEYKLLTRRSLERRGVDPQDWENWSN